MDYRDYLEQGKGEVHFWHHARLELIDKLLASIYGDEAGGRLILDLGCGTGEETAVLKKFGRVIGADKSEEVLKLAKAKGNEVMFFDVEKQELPAVGYDAVCVFDLLEHLKDDERALKNIYQALKPGGYLFFTAPAFKFIFSPHDLALGHERRYGRRELEKKIKQRGFSQVESYFWNSLFFLPLAALRIFKNLVLIKFLRRKEFRSEARPLNKILNAWLFYLLKLENKLLFKKRWLPFGLTIYGVAKK